MNPHLNDVHQSIPKKSYPDRVEPKLVFKLSIDTRPFGRRLVSVSCFARGETLVGTAFTFEPCHTPGLL